jgi:hypothetical protein
MTITIFDLDKIADASLTQEFKNAVRRHDQVFFRDPVFLLIGTSKAKLPKRVPKPIASKN